MKLSENEKHLHETFIRYGTNAKDWMRKCVLLIPEIEKHKIWRKKGFGNIYEYAVKLAGMSKNTVDEALRVLKRLENKPALQKIAKEYGIQKVRPVAAIATEESEKFWAEKAIQMSKNTLETYVREYKNSTMFLQDKNDTLCKQPTQQNPDGKIINDNRLRLLPREDFQPVKNFDESARLSEPSRSETITMELAPEIAKKLQKLKGRDDWNTLMKQLLALREKRIESEKPEAAQTRSRHIPVKIKKYIIERTNGTCAFPSCTHQYTILHHTHRFSLSRCHDPDTIVPLCKAHERLAHFGLIENEEMSSEYWKIRRKPDNLDLKYMIDRNVKHFREKALYPP